MKLKFAYSNCHEVSINSAAALSCRFFWVLVFNNKFINCYVCQIEVFDNS